MGRGKGQPSETEREERSQCTGLAEGAGGRARVQSGHLAPVTSLQKGAENEVSGAWDCLPERGRSPSPCCGRKGPSSRPQGTPELKGTLVPSAAGYGHTAPRKPTLGPGQEALVSSVAHFWGKDSASSLMPA